MSPDPSRRFEQVVALAPLLASMLFTAVALLPELRPLPNVNDDAFHFLMIQEARDTLARGGNLSDFWSPVLELGFPQFLYYQHLPHLVVVFLDRLLPAPVDLISSFNAVRYALLVGFPVTVYWSLTRLGFSRHGSVLAAALSPLFAGSFNYGFEYDSYVWRGLGMYTQLWAMHLSLVSLALLADFLDRGRHGVAATAALSALILSHLVYAYMMALSAAFLLLWGLRGENARGRLLRFAAVWGAAAAVTAYFWVPFLWSKSYLSISPYLERWKYDSFGAAAILKRLATGALFDHGRLPVITGLALGGAIAALITRSRPALLAVVFFAFWLALYFGRATWGSLTVLLPLHDGLIMHRFIGGVHIATLMLIAAAGAGLWQLASRLPVGATPLLVLGALALMTPALLERQAFHRYNGTLIARNEAALAAEADAQAIIDRLKALPPGRTFAGLRTDFGKQLRVGDLAFSDLLTYHRIPALAPPYQSLSLNADLLWHFDYRRRADYEVFNVRYVVAPAEEPMPAFLDLVERRGRYALYRAEPSGYFAIGRADLAFSGRPSDLLVAARAWLGGPLATAGQFPQVSFGADRVSGQPLPSQPLSEAPRIMAAHAPSPPPAGRVLREVVGPQSYAATVSLDEPATVVLKVTYHPNWRATVDGAHAAAFMVMPSYIGLRLPAGRHDIVLDYAGSALRSTLLAVSAVLVTLVAAAAGVRRWRRKPVVAR